MKLIKTAILFFLASLLMGTARGEGAHVGLYAALNAAMSGQHISQVDNQYAGNSGTGNYRIMFAASHYLDALHFGDEALKSKRRARVIELLSDFHMVSRNANEQFVFDPHANFWIASLVAITQGAGESGDKPVIDLCNQWWATHLYWLEKGWNGKSVRLPGTRAKTDPIWDVDTKVYKLTHGIPFKIGDGEVLSIVYLGRLLKKYPQAITKARIPGKLVMPMHVEANGVIWMEKPAQLPLEPVDWVSATAFGRDWTTPVPKTPSSKE